MTKERTHNTDIKGQEKQKGSQKHGVSGYRGACCAGMGTGVQIPAPTKKPGMAMHTCDPSTREGGEDRRIAGASGSVRGPDLED